jgi:hypothetical protein
MELKYRVFRASQFEELFINTAVLWSRVLFATSLPPVLKWLPSTSQRVVSDSERALCVYDKLFRTTAAWGFHCVAGAGEGWPVGLLRAVICRFVIFLICT